jgi:hypothetical protein
MKAPIKLVLPLLRQAPRAHNEAALKIATSDQFLDQQPCHDRLSRPRIIRQQEPQRLARQHGLINGGDLMWQRLND